MLERSIVTLCCMLPQQSTEDEAMSPQKYGANMEHHSLGCGRRVGKVDLASCYISQSDRHLHDSLKCTPSTILLMKTEHAT